VRYCPKCATAHKAHDMYQCGRCKQTVCLACLDTVNVNQCKECAVITRQEEILARLERTKGE
jgi:hypothetical protein